MNPIIHYANILTGATITATGISDDTPLFITDGRPYTFLTLPASGTNYVTVDCAGATPANSLGIIGHNLHSAAATVTLQSSTNGSTWTDQISFTPATDRALLKTFTQASARYWRLKIVTASVAPQLAVVVLGKRLDLPAPPDASFTPYSEGVEADTNDSKAGHPLGSVVRYFPADIKPSFSNIERTWLEETYRPFRETWGRYRKYFFWAWDLETYPDQVFYVQDIGKYAPSVSHLDYYDRLTLELKGVVEP